MFSSKTCGSCLRFKLNFNTHVDQKVKTCNKMIGCRFSLQRFTDNIYISFVRPQLDYGDMLYDKPKNENFQNKIKKVRCRASLAITGGTQETYRERRCYEVGLHSVVKRRLRNDLVFFIKY